MPVWFQIAIALNVIYWAIFFYLLSRRRWNFAALMVGLFHMLFALTVSAAPIRATLDPNYMNFGLGFIQVKGQAAALPAALVLGWALTAAWISVVKDRGRWMTLIAVGDIFLALNMGGSILVSKSEEWKFQLGESVSITGVAGLLILLLFFTAPFIVSAIWAIRRAGSDGTTSPLTRNVEDKHKGSEKDIKDTNRLRYSQSRA